eukprot:COSAG04_NODE_819_length_10078_cov_2.881451_8_plen_251_part_00
MLRALALALVAAPTTATSCQYDLDCSEDQYCDSTFICSPNQPFPALSTCADRMVLECEAEGAACTESWEGATSNEFAEQAEALMAGPGTELGYGSSASPSRLQCFADFVSEQQHLSEQQHITGRRRSMSSGTPAICSSGHGACQGLYDCQYDSMVNCMKALDVLDDILDMSKSFVSCISESSGCKDPGRFRGGGAVTLVLAALAIGAAAAFKRKKDSDLIKSGSAVAVANVVAQPYAPPEMAAAVGDSKV